MTTATDRRMPHLFAAVAGVVAVVAAIVLPGNTFGYVVGVAIGIGAVIIGHRAARLKGPLRWAAIVGLVLAYHGLIIFAGLLAVRLARVMGG